MDRHRLQPRADLAPGRHRLPARRAPLLPLLQLRVVRALLRLRAQAQRAPRRLVRVRHLPGTHDGGGDLGRDPDTPLDAEHRGVGRHGKRVHPEDIPSAAALPPRPHAPVDARAHDPDQGHGGRHALRVLHAVPALHPALRLRHPHDAADGWQPDLRPRTRELLQEHPNVDVQPPALRHLPRQPRSCHGRHHESACGLRVPLPGLHRALCAHGDEHAHRRALRGRAGGGHHGEGGDAPVLRQEQDAADRPCHRRGRRRHDLQGRVQDHPQEAGGDPGPGRSRRGSDRPRRLHRLHLRGREPQRPGRRHEGQRAHLQRIHGRGVGVPRM
mmetsp:Transcript_13072/g.33699  ORF Transcript_13072/g.33699 Transcript_13072/m.33699 type:complete len:328 (+) Transcript_13072:676-1659(+)